MLEIEREVRSFVVDNFLFGDDSDLRDSDSFLERALIDSTGVLELVAFVEKHYHITVEDHEVVPANLDSIDRVTRFVTSKLERQAGLAG
jgi:acyl carrier protein